MSVGEPTDTARQQSRSEKERLIVNIGTKRRQVDIAPVLLSGVAFLLFYFAAARDYTWVFQSSDQGGWLAVSKMWLVPQPMGDPLYVMLGKILDATGGITPFKLVLVGSCLPSAITVGMVYIIVKRITGKCLPALAASVVLLGAAVFMTESTVGKEYAMAAMWLTIGYYLYIRGNRKLALVALGLGTITHTMVLGVTLLWWLVCEWKNKWQWLKIAWIYVLVGVLPYIMVPVLMAQDSVPPLMAEHFSIGGLRYYTTSVSQAIMGQLSITDAPSRLFALFGITMASLGIAVVPLVMGLLKKTDGIERKHKNAAVAAVLWVVWYYGTCLDPTTWTYLSMAAPFVAVLVGMGIAVFMQDRIATEWVGEKLERERHIVRWGTKKVAYAVLAGAVVLGTFNTAFLNADDLTHKEPLASDIEEQIMQMPEESVVVVLPGAYSMAVFYAMSNGRDDLTPLLWGDTEDWRGNHTDDYYRWLHEEKGLEGENPLEIAQSALGQGRAVYMADDTWRFEEGMVGVGGDWWGDWITCMQWGNTVMAGKGLGQVREIVGVVDNRPIKTMAQGAGQYNE